MGILFSLDITCVCGGSDFFFFPAAALTLGSVRTSVVQHPRVVRRLLRGSCAGAARPRRFLPGRRAGTGRSICRNRPTARQEPPAVWAVPAREPPAVWAVPSREPAGSCPAAARPGGRCGRNRPAPAGMMAAGTGRLLPQRSGNRPAPAQEPRGFISTSRPELPVLTSPRNALTRPAPCAPTRPRRLRTRTLSPCLVIARLLLLAGRSAARLPGQQSTLARTAARPLLLLRAAPGRANGACRSGPPWARSRPSPRWPTPTPSRPFSPTPPARAARTGRRRRRRRSSSSHPTSRR